MSNINEFNRTVIAEFRANGGKVGGQYADAVAKHDRCQER